MGSNFFKHKSNVVRKYEQAIDLGENVKFSPDQFLEIIDYYYFERLLDKALIATNLALKLYPTDYEIILRKARILTDLEKYKEALSIVKYLKLENSNDPEIFLLEGFCYFALNKPIKAKKAFQYLIKSAITKEEKFIYLTDAAKIALKFKHYNLAYNYFKQAYNLQPQEYHLIYEMAFCLERQNRNKESQKLYLKYLEKNPLSKLAWYNLGVVYMKQKIYKKALEAFEFALALDPKFESALYNKAYVLFMQNNFKQSIKTFQEIINQNPDSPAAYFYIAKNYIELKQYKNAIIYLIKVLNSVPLFAQAWYELARILFLLKKFDKSKKLIIKALKLDELNPQYLNLLGKIYIELNKFSKAAIALKLATISNPFNDDNWFTYSEIFEKSNDTEKAIEILENGKDFINNKIVLNLKLAYLYKLKGDEIKMYSYLQAINSSNHLKIKSIINQLFSNHQKFNKFINYLKA